MTSRALSFGSEADAYHRYRPGYPDEVVEIVLAHARGDVRRALEIGAGTGLATATFASRGDLEIVAIEPDPGMRAVLSPQIDAHGWPVEVVDGDFESVSPDRDGVFDLVYAAASFHWTDPETRWERVGSVLRPGGVLALMGAARELADDSLRVATDDLADSVLGPDNDPAVSKWRLPEMQARPELEAVEEVVLPRSVTIPADDHVAHLTTVSAYKMLAEPVRADLLSRIRALLPDMVEVSQDVTLRLARRAGAA